MKKTIDTYSADVYKDLREHPVAGIPKIVAYYEDGGKLTVIEEYISGVTLRDKIEKTWALPASKAGSANTDNSGDVPIPMQ